MELKIEMSEQINEIAAAMAKAQGQMKPAVKDKINPYYKSGYASFQSIWEACRLPLSENGIAVIQLTCENEKGEPNIMTLLLHSSGQWIKGPYPIYSVDKKPQSMGSGVSYAKRYSLAGTVGVVITDDDDDGEAAQGREAKTSVSKKESVNTAEKKEPQKISENQVAIIKAKLNGHTEVIDDVNNVLIKGYGISKYDQMTVDIFDRMLKYIDQQIKTKYKEAVG